MISKIILLGVYITNVEIIGNIEQDLSDALISLKVSNSEFRILVEGKEIICDKKLLVSECDYFKALVNFEEDVSNTIEIKGGVDSDSCKIIFDFPKRLYISFLKSFIAEMKNL